MTKIPQRNVLWIVNMKELKNVLKLFSVLRLPSSKFLPNFILHFQERKVELQGHFMSFVMLQYVLHLVKRTVV